MEILHGVDLVELSKFRDVLVRHPAFTRELYTDAERAYCESCAHPARHFAGRFAAKEAALKALGLGITAGIDRTLREVEVTRAESGKPALRLHGWVETVAARLRLGPSALSISHAADYVVASVIFVGDAPASSPGRA